jgi:aquaporin Z
MASFGRPGTGGTTVMDGATARRYMAELIGTGLLVFFGAGMATIVFGFRAYGGSVAAGILLTGLVFGLILLGLVAFVGPISGCHINPAVTLGAYLSRRISLMDAAGYWAAQVIGGILGALLLLWVMHGSAFYSKAKNGLGANGYGNLSLLHTSGGGAFLAEVILTAVFVLVVLSATRKEASAPVAGLIVGFVLALVNIFGIPIDGASVNPARSIGPALIVGGPALSQLWLFILAPLIGGVLAAGVFMLFNPVPDTAAVPGPGDVKAETTMTLSAADEEDARRRAGTATTASPTGPGPQAPAGTGSSGQTGASPGTPPAGKPPEDPPAGTARR